MNVYTLNGPGYRSPNYMGNLPTLPPDPTAGVPAGDTAAPPAGSGQGVANTVEDVQSSVGYLRWAQGLVNAGNSVIRRFMQALGLGPNYETEGGGEIRRQLQSESMGADRWTDKAIELYMGWLRDYHPRRGAATTGRAPGEGYGSGFDERVNPCTWTLPPSVRVAIESGGLGGAVSTGACADIWQPDGFTPTDFVAWMQDRIPGWMPQRAAIAPTPQQDQSLRTIALQRIGVDTPENNAAGEAAYQGLDYDWQRLVDAYQMAYLRRASTEPAPPAGGGGDGAPAPNDEQLAVLQQLAVGLAGLAGSEAQATGRELYAQLPASWQRLVDAMVVQLGGTPPAGGAAADGDGVPWGALAALAAVVLLARS